MTESFKAKARRVGTSIGVLIPKGVIHQQKIKIGQELQLFFLKPKRLEEIEKMFGTAKGAKPFERDRTDRVDRW